MRLLFVVLAIAINGAFVLPAHSQPKTQPTKPELAWDYFDQLHYALPKGLSLIDSVRFRAEMQRLAQQVLASVDQAFAQYRVSDPGLKAILLDVRTSAYSVLNRPRQTIQTVQEHRKLLPAPAYQSPHGLLPLALAEASQRLTQEGKSLSDEQIAPVLRQTFRAQFANLAAAHRADIVNATKGAVSARMFPVHRRTMEHLLEQAQQSGKLVFENAQYLLLTYDRYSALGRFQRDLEAVLYELSPARVEEQTVQIPMRDGIRLNGILYRDVASTEKVPALVSLSPYPSGNEGLKGNVFATNGYVYLYVDTRGRRDSEGAFFPYEHDAQDYYDIIDWASRQPWCDGQVGTTGGSYLGFAQWQAIRKAHKHPALKAINPMVAVGFGVDFPRESHIFYSYILQWATLVSGKELNDALFYDFSFWAGKAYQAYKHRIRFARLDSVAGMPNPYFQRWISHPDFDTYWRGILPGPEDYAALDIPVLTTTGYYDGDQNGALYYYQQHQRWGSEAAKARHHVLIGPFDHAGAQWQPRATQGGQVIEKEAQIPLYKYVIHWFDWVLKGKPKPAFIQDRITYFAVGTGQWRGTPSFAATTQDTLRLYLSANPVSHPKRKTLYRLQAKPDRSAQSIRYTHDIAATLDSAWLFAAEKPYDDTRYLTSPHNLVFETAPLESDLLVTDRIIPRLKMSLNVPDADFMVRLYEVTPDGKNHAIGYSAARARYRNGGDRPQLMTPGQPEEIAIDNMYIYVRKLSRGSRLRMTFESINTPEYEKNYGFGGVVSQESTQSPRLIEATLYPDGSRIEIPYARVPLANRPK